MTWCWKLGNPLEDHVSVLDLPHGCAATKPFLSPIIRQNYFEFMNNVEDRKGQRNLSVPEFTWTHEGKYHLFTLFFRISTNSVSSSVLAHSSWASKAELNTCRCQKTNSRFKETIIYGYQLSTTLVQINFQTRSWFPCLSVLHNEAYAPTTAKRRDWRPTDDEEDVRCFTLPQMYSRLVWRVENGSR